MAGYKKAKKSKDEVTEQKKRMLEAVDKEQDVIWHEQETMKNFLMFAATFHRYSYNNQLLIHAKFPNAAMVQTYGGWIKKGRKVKPAENKNYIEIFAPIPKTAMVTKDVLDDNGHCVLDEDGNKKTKKESVNYMDYRIVYVYEASQTTGDRLPELANEFEDPLYETEGDLFTALKQISGNISEHMSPCDMLRCVSQQFLKQQYLIYQSYETEACTCILSGYLQLGLEDCDANAVFEWAKGRDKKEISGSMERIQKVCKKIITKLEETECLQLSS